MPEKDDPKQFDRRLGYFILAILLLVIAGSIGYGIFFARTPEPRRVISFDMIGNLRIDDPVSLKGLAIGTIVDIRWRPRSVLVFIQPSQNLVLHKGYTVDNRDVGLMGDRALLIDDPNPAAPVIAPADTLAG